MKFKGLWIAGLILVATVGQVQAGFISLNFDSSVSGTISDQNGLGTGFTHRLPGSGSALPSSDPNLVLDTVNSRLIVGSTRSDINGNGFGRNLEGMEAPGLLLSGIGTRNFSVEAVFRDLLVEQPSDQIGIYVGSSVDLVVRGGVHEQSNSPIVQYINHSSLRARMQQTEHRHSELSAALVVGMTLYFVCNEPMVCGRSTGRT